MNKVLMTALIVIVALGIIIGVSVVYGDNSSSKITEQATQHLCSTKNMQCDKDSCNGLCKSGRSCDCGCGG